MVTAAADDPIRDEVERLLHAMVGATMAAPAAVVGGARRCVARRAGMIRDRLLRPARLVTSLLDLAGGSPAGSSSAPVVTADRPRRASGVSSEPSTDAGPPGVGPDVSTELPIEEYESLAASQVVARLPSLTSAELADVRRFEADHRGRRTVLGKIDQLLVTT